MGHSLTKGGEHVITSNINPKVDEIMKEVVDLSVQKFGDELRQIWLFGSQVTGTAHDDSDIDVAVVLDKPVTAWKVRGEVYSDFSMDILTRYGELLYVNIADENEFESGRTPLYEGIKGTGVLFYGKQ